MVHQPLPLMTISSSRRRVRPLDIGPSSSESHTPSSETLSNSLLDPSTTWIFMVGINDQWENDRNTIGDVALHQSFIDFYSDYHHHDDGEFEHYDGDERIVFIKDRNATTCFVRHQFMQMLRKTREGDSLIFYFGGHGRRTHFCTHDDDDDLLGENGIGSGTGSGGWLHSDVVDMIEQYFQGDFSLILLDCCYAGNFSSALLDRQRRCDVGPISNISYGCIMVTSPDESAQVNWTLTDRLIRAVRCNRSRIEDDFTMDDMKEIDIRKDGIITLDEVASYVSDHITREKRDLATAYFVGNFCPEKTPFLRPRALSTQAFSTYSPHSTQKRQAKQLLSPSSVQCLLGNNILSYNSSPIRDRDECWGVPIPKRTRIEHHPEDNNDTINSYHYGCRNLFKKLKTNLSPSTPPLMSTMSQLRGKRPQQLTDVWAEGISSSSASSRNLSPLTPGSKVYAKWDRVRRLEGKKMFNGVDLHVMPMWFAGTVISSTKIEKMNDDECFSTFNFNNDSDDFSCSKDDDKDDELVTVELKDNATCLTWQTTVLRSTLLSQYHFCHHAVHARGSCVMIHCRMAMANDVVNAADTHNDTLRRMQNMQRRSNKTLRKRRHCRRYLSFELQAGTQIRVLWPDSKFYRATVAFLGDVPWDDMLSLMPTSTSSTSGTLPFSHKKNSGGGTYLDTINECFGREGGAYVPVIWKEQKTHSLVPLSRCVVCTELEDDLFPQDNIFENGLHNESELVARVQAAARDSAREAIKNIQSPKEAFMRSMKSAGKMLRPISSKNNTKLTCFWPERGMWYDAHAIDIRNYDNTGDNYDVDNIPLEALAGHLCYEERGVYHAVKWDIDGIISLLPKAFVRKHKKKERMLEL